ncbi:MAG: hypothetical protein ONB46_09480 [candidate division KSB1 bacterium]|nr:hypothetical protein [candidate division KSB1 bacterium]MDZ7366033.1 hypothetical protein [candidate division KSB1 bacterium]MDZ7404150.1 hypothetical protein [candidate division KSB1 bacterium]
MKMMSALHFSLAIACLFVACQKEQASLRQSQFEPFLEEPANVLGRGLVALPTNRGVFLSWRQLQEDSSGTIYEVYRRDLDAPQSGTQMITQTALTSFLDGSALAGRDYAYEIKTPRGQETNGQSHAQAIASLKVSPSRYPAAHALAFDLGMPYQHVQVVTGDLTGDGEFDVVIKHSNFWDVDPWEKAWQQSQDTYKISAFLTSGQRLWMIDLGWGIESGVFYSPVVVWDIDADGRAEVLLKTSKSSDPKDYSQQFLTVLDGETGAIKNEAPWPSAEGLGGNYNSDSRNYIAVVHPDGKNPHILIARGLYVNQRLVCYDNKLQKVWERLIDDGTHGLHSLPIADVNDDGKEEIMWGEHCIGEGGKDLWIIKDRMPYEGHPDICYVADVLPWRPGKEIYYCREGWYGDKNERIGMMLADNKGKLIWANWNYRHVDGGWVAKVLPGTDGMQCYAYDIGKKVINEQGVKIDTIYQYLFSGDGKLLAEPDMHGSFPLDWDGDGVREIARHDGSISRFGGPVIAKVDSGALFGADLFGDHREEIVVAPLDGKVYIYFNTEPLTVWPRVTPLADRQYRNDVSRTAMQHNLIPYEGGTLTPSAARSSGASEVKTASTIAAKKVRTPYERTNND